MTIDSSGQDTSAWQGIDSSQPADRDGVVLLVGTRKGLWILVSDAERQSWAMRGPSHLGQIIHHAVLDPRDQRTLLATTSTGHLGPTMARSTDLGRTWTEVALPPAFDEGDRLERSVQFSFWLTPGHASEDGTWYAGASPQALFRSEDAGNTWKAVRGWNDNPQWEEWCEYPIVGTPSGSIVHSVIVDPRDAAHLYIGLSGGGIFESDDAGESWQPFNEGVAADFLPDPDAAYGHDPHCVRQHPLQPDRLYHQNHCGIYRVDRPATRWERIGDAMPREVGDIGFPIELHPRDPDTAWVFPMDGTDVWPRTSPGGRPAAYRTQDAGTSWTRCGAGFPERAWWTVKRQAMTTDHAASVGVYLGTTSGEVWGSVDEGDHWMPIAAHLPEIYSVEYADPSDRS